MGGFVSSLARTRAFTKRIRCVAFACFVLFSCYMLLTLFTRRKAIKEAFGGSSKRFIFDLENEPYGSLLNGNCSLDAKNIWNCPDIRRAGKNDLRQAQLVLTRMLLIFDAIAKRKEIRYWLSRGTLLGAARHKGNIPWDIDLDIEMPKEDYFRFLRLGIDLLPKDMVLQRHEQELESEKAAKKARGSDEIQLSYELPRSPWNPRFRDNKSCYKWCLKFKCSWHDGLMIDIYPVEVNNSYFRDPLGSEEPSSVGFKAFPLKKLQFEGLSFPVPYGWRNELKTIYGDDFMAIPPKHKRVPPDGLVPDPIHSCSELGVDH